MRCNNCGWENPDHNTRCEKCNAPLQGGASYQPAQPAQQHNLNSTVIESEVFPGAPAQGQQAPYQQAGASNLCPKCGYPLRDGSQVCPNCGGQSSTERETPQFASQAAHNTGAQAAQVHQQPKQVTGTVNPWVQVAPAAKVTLTPVKQDTEAQAPAPQQFKGDAHELNRANLDAENLTITSKVQAVLTCENGQWYIEDKSAQHTTFVYVGKKTPINDGDVILMGNRQFIFTEDK